MGKEQSLYNEQQLIQACIDNDPRAQKELFNTYAPKLLGVCARYCQNMEDAKDALHEGFIKVFRQLQKFKGDSKLETWMTRIMIYTAIDHFKKSIKYKLFEKDADVYATANMSEEQFEIEKDKVDINKLYASIQELPDGYRMVFSLYAIDEFSHKQIAEKLGISVGTSKSQLARARKMLQGIVKQRLNIE
mgnify:CR=1 FL=1